MFLSFSLLVSLLCLGLPLPPLSVLALFSSRFFPCGSSKASATSGWRFYQLQSPLPKCSTLSPLAPAKVLESLPIDFAWTIIGAKGIIWLAIPDSCTHPGAWMWSHLNLHVESKDGWLSKRRYHCQKGGRTKKTSTTRVYWQVPHRPKQVDKRWDRSSQAQVQSRNQWKSGRGTMVWGNSSSGQSQAREGQRGLETWVGPISPPDIES